MNLICLKQHSGALLTSSSSQDEVGLFGGLGLQREVEPGYELPMELAHVYKVAFCTLTFLLHCRCMSNVQLIPKLLQALF